MLKDQWGWSGPSKGHRRKEARSERGKARWQLTRHVRALAFIYPKGWEGLEWTW